MPSSSPSPGLASESPFPSRSSPRAKYVALAILFSINLLNYVDRYSFFAVGAQIQKDLQIDDRGYGFLCASFMIVYTLVSPFIGWVGDRYDRRVMLALGVGLWSLATVGTAFSTGFWSMFFWRALLGVGEASYGVLAPTLLADLFAPKHRGRVLGIYFLALPLGGALGYGIGGWVGERWGWPSSFWVVGLPGLLAAFAALTVHDPGRGASEGFRHAGKADRPKLGDYLVLVQTPSFFYNTFGMAAVTFATGGLAAWAATFYQRVQGMNATQAGAWIGGLTALAGLIGIGLGSWVADLLLKVTRRAYMLIGCMAVLISVPLGSAAFLDPEPASSLALLFVAMVPMAAVLGPCNAVTANVVPPTQRAAGYALSTFLIHLFGDISSPNVIGWISDRAGRPDVMRSLPGRVLAGLGAVPLGDPPTNLTAGMLSVIPVLLVGGGLFLLGSRHLPHDQARVRALAEGAEADGLAVMH